MSDKELRAFERALEQCDGEAALLHGPAVLRFAKQACDGQGMREQAPREPRSGDSVMTVNGRTYRGRDVTVRNGKVIVDGVEQGSGLDALARPLEVRVLEGVLGRLEADGDVTCGSVSGAVNASGDVSVTGDVGGSVNTSGDVKCGNVGQGVNTTGDVRCGNVGGNVMTAGDVRYVRG